MDSYYKTFISRLISHGLILQDLYYMDSYYKAFISRLILHGFILQDLYLKTYIAKSILQLVTKADSKLTQWKSLSVI